MRRVGYALALSLSFAMIGCVSTKPADTPLETSGETTPPPGCEDLRERGGAC